MAGKQYWKEYLTTEEYLSLAYPGKMMIDYWAQWLPKMCKKLKAKGTLYQILETEGHRLAELRMDLIRRGYPEDGSLEVIKEEIYQLPPER